MSIMNTRALLLFTLFTVLGCGPSLEEKKKIAEEEADRANRIEKAINATKEHFGLIHNAGSWVRWSVESITVGERYNFSPNKITIKIKLSIPAKYSEEILQRSPESQFRAVAYTACPNKTAAVWKSFGKDDDIVIQGLHYGKVFIDVDCRRWAQ